MNHHLVKARQSEIQNLGNGLSDSKCLLYVMNQLDSTNCSLDDLDNDDDATKAQITIDCSKRMGSREIVGPKDIFKDMFKVNMLFLAELFNTKHGLMLTND